MESEDTVLENVTGSLVPKDAHALSPETWDCVALQGERDFADMIKLRLFR